MTLAQAAVLLKISKLIVDEDVMEHFEKNQTITVEERSAWCEMIRRARELTDVYDRREIALAIAGRLEE